MTCGNRFSETGRPFDRNPMPLQHHYSHDQGHGPEGLGFNAAHRTFHMLIHAATPLASSKCSSPMSAELHTPDPLPCNRLPHSCNPKDTHLPEESLIVG